MSSNDLTKGHFLFYTLYIQTKVSYGFVTDHLVNLMRFSFMEDLQLHQQIVHEWKNNDVKDIFILRIAIKAMQVTGQHQEMIVCCEKLIKQEECDHVNFVFNSHWAATHLSNLHRYHTHMIAVSYLQDAVKVINRNPDFHQLSNGEEFYQSKLYHAFMTYYELGRVNLYLANFCEARNCLSKAMGIQDQYEAEFDRNADLEYKKIRLQYYAGQCCTLQADLDEGLNLLMKSLESVENKMSNNLHLLVGHLYHISWNLLISGRPNDAICYINRAVDILDENDDADNNSIRVHQRCVADLQSEDMSPSLLLFRYRYN